jgi:translocation and assembly module TamB
MRLGRANLVARARGGKTSIDPVDSTINEGRLHVEPSYRDGEGGPALVLGKGTRLTDARVNDEVSRRVLSFVAPILNNATRVNGLVSADIDEAVFPLRREGSAGATVKGSVVFQDVRFAPSGVFRDLLAQVGREDVSLIRIDKPVAMEIADRRVYQRGLVIPVGKLSQVEMDGWVGFDRDLNVTISLPVLPTALADKPVIGGIAANSRIRIPIRGTMDKPEIDEEAFKVGMKELGKSVLEQGLGQGILDLFKRLGQGRDPNAPPPPPRLTPQQRKERRMEKKADRRMRRGLPP